MDIRVQGSNMEIGNSLTNHVKERLNDVVKKYFDTAVNADIFFAKDKNSFRVNIVVNEGVRNINIRSNANSGDAYSSFENALEKVTKQLRRYKDKIKNYRRSHGGIKSVNLDDKIFDVPKYIIPAVPYGLFEEIEEEEIKNIQQEDSLNVIEEKTTKIEKLSVNEAIMKMDLANLPALAFINKQNGRVNMVYSRKDGNISWIDPIVEEK